MQGNPHEHQICKINVLRCNDAQPTAATSPPSNIVYASLKWEHGGLISPLGQALSSDQERGVHAALGALPDFPSNALNGCESRAHATYLAIHQASGLKSYKIWLLSAPLVAPGFNGGIRYKDGGAWNYHVAAAYATEGQGVVVVDTLMSKTPQRFEEWLGRFTVEGWAVVVSTPPWQYIYGVTSVSGLEGIADFPSSILHPDHKMKRNVFNGTFLQYGGRISDVHDGAKAIASDALAAAISQGKFGTCPWRQYSSDSIALIRSAAAFLPNVPSREDYTKHDEDCAKLQKNNPSAACPPFSVSQRTAPPAECAEAFQIFKSEYDRWAALGL